MRDIAQQEKCNFLMVTHNSAISQIANKVVHLHSGEISKIDINENPEDPENLVW
jgi:putative ABC transport system ATP-binding protein